MQVSCSSRLKHAFKRCIKGKANLETKFFEKLAQFSEDLFDKSPRNHKLSGKLDEIWSFSTTYDIRVLFHFSDDRSALFIGIGGHDDV